MAIVTINLGLKPEYQELINDILKFIIIGIVFHYFMVYGHSKGNIGHSGVFLNNDFLEAFIYFILSLYIYHIIFKKLILIT